jgi:hypothetical protein
MGMNTRFTAVSLFGLGIIMLSSCAELGAIYVARDMKKTFDKYEQQEREARVEELNKEFEEFRTSRGDAATDDDEPEPSIVKLKNNQ